MTPPFNKPSSSSGTTPSYDSYLLDLQSHVFPYRSLKPLTPPSRPPVPAYLSCWWTGDSTDFWGHYLETTSLRFSEPLSSRCRRDNDRPTIAPMTQWREQFKRRRTIDPLLPSSNHAPHAPLGPLPPPTQFRPPTPRLTHCPNWPDEQTHFPLVEPTPYLPESDTGGTLLRLKEVGLELTEEELRQWALDTLLYPEDWKWLWESPAQAPTPLTSPTPLPLPLQWYDASNVGPLNMSAPCVPSTSVPSADWQRLDIPNEPVPCAPVPYVGSSVMWGPVAQPLPQRVHLPPEWLTEGIIESGSRSNGGGNVMVEEPPIPFSPFSSADCTMFDHFSFNDFIAIAFPDIAGDLDL